MDPPITVKVLRVVCCGAFCGSGMELAASALAWLNGGAYDESSSRKSYFDPQCNAANLSVELNRGYSRINQVQRAMLQSAVQVPELFDGLGVISRVLAQHHRKRRFLIIASENDAVVPIHPSLKRWTDVMVSQGRKNSYQIELVPRAGHCVMMEKPDEVEDAILRFFQNARGSGDNGDGDDGDGDNGYGVGGGGDGGDNRM